MDFQHSLREAFDKVHESFYSKIPGLSGLNTLYGGALVSLGLMAASPAQAEPQVTQSDVVIVQTQSEEGADICARMGNPANPAIILTCKGTLGVDIETTGDKPSSPAVSTAPTLPSPL